MELLIYCKAIIMVSVKPFMHSELPPGFESLRVCKNTEQDNIRPLIQSFLSNKFEEIDKNKLLMN